MKSSRSHIISTLVWGASFALAAIFCLQAISSSLNILVEHEILMGMEMMDAENEEEVEENADECEMIYVCYGEDVFIIQSEKLSRIHRKGVSEDNHGILTPPPEMLA